MAMEMEMVIVILNSDSISDSTRMRRMIGRATDLRFGMRRVQLLPPSLRPHRCLHVHTSLLLDGLFA